MSAAAAVLVPGRTCRLTAEATRAAVIIDADDYFRHARAAMLNARRRIMLVGWDFDARITLGRDAGADDAPEHLGDFILWLVENRPELEIYLLRWDLGAFKSLFRGNTIIKLLQWMRHPRIHTRLDRHHPTAGSHHQKIVVVDDVLAFCGGIDMTEDRWDTRAHRPADPRRRKPNGQPYMPWHDVTTAIEGPMAGAVAEIARERWVASGGTSLATLPPLDSPWPQALAADFTDVTMGVSRTLPEMVDQAPVTEIEQLYVALIGQAKRWIYAESQYFASRRIAEAIAKRLEEADGPEIVLINPVTAQGWLEPMAMDTARARLYEALHRRDKYGRFRIFHPYTSDGEAIYVHAKVLVVDDEVLRVGSSNMNNRSLRLDTECDVTVVAETEAVRAVVGGIRNDLLAEHLGVTAEVVAEMLMRTDSLLATVKALQGQPKTLRDYETPDLNAVETWLADNEVLDPEGPAEMFEGFSRRGLFRRWPLRRKAAR